MSIKTCLNVGSGQRPFHDVLDAVRWINLDCQERWKPDIFGDWNDLTPWFKDGSVDLVVAHHTLEHVGCGEGSGFLKEAFRVLKPGGSLLVFVPDMKALAQRWLLGQLDEQVYMTNVYGAFMGDEADRHRWGYSGAGLYSILKTSAAWRDVHHFDWRNIAGADIAHDWWILGMECVK